MSRRSRPAPAPRWPISLPSSIPPPGPAPALAPAPLAGPAGSGLRQDFGLPPRDKRQHPTMPPPAPGPCYRPLRPQKRPPVPLCLAPGQRPSFAPRPRLRETDRQSPARLPGIPARRCPPPPLSAPTWTSPAPAGGLPLARRTYHCRVRCGVWWRGSAHRYRSQPLGGMSSLPGVGGCLTGPGGADGNGCLFTQRNTAQGFGPDSTCNPVCCLTNDMQLGTEGRHGDRL